MHGLKKSSVLSISFIMSHLVSRLGQKKIKSFELSLIFSFLVLLNIAFVEGKIEIEVKTTIKNQCTEKKHEINQNLNWDTSSTSMQNVAYMWTHGKNLENWRYEDVKENNRPVSTTFLTFPEPHCSIIEYDTYVQMPKVFLSYIPGAKMQTHVHKKICSTNKNLIETVKFSKKFLLGQFTVHLNAAIDDTRQQTAFQITSEIDLPWFVLPIKSIISEEIRKSMKEYIALLVNSLCI
jgi:hypothetical protein